MHYVKFKSRRKDSEASHISEFLCPTPEIGEAVIQSMKTLRGDDYQIVILESKEVNAKQYKHLGTYTAPNTFEIPKDFSLTSDKK